MTGWYIFLGIVAFILILLICPLNFYISYDDEVRLTLRYLFLRFRLIPKPPKKPGKEKKAEKQDEKTDESSDDSKDENGEKKSEEKKKSTLSLYIEQHGLSGLIELIKKLVSIAVDTLKKIARHIYIKKLDIKAIIVGDDSADTAIKYGYACSVIYPAVSMLDCTCHLKAHSEDVIAGFQAEKTVAELYAAVRISPLFLIGAALSGGFKFLWVIIKSSLKK